MIALTIFGTPQGADAIVHPQIDLTLPGSLNQAIDAPFKYYPEVEVFRLCRFRQEIKSTYLYALQTQCFDMRGPREGAFIGVGIFTTEYEKIDPALLVRGLRDLLESAQRAVTFDGKFTKTITEARRQFQIPAAIDKILNIGQGGATPPSIVSGILRDFFVLGESPLAQIESLIEMFQSAPFLPLDNVYASTDARVTVDCRSDNITTVFDSISGFLQRHDQIVRTEVAALSRKLKNSEAEVHVLNDEAATAAMHFRAKVEQGIALEHNKFRNEKLNLQLEIKRLKNERYDRLTTASEICVADSEWSWWALGLAVVVFVMLVMLGCWWAFDIWTNHSWWMSLLWAALILVPLSQFAVLTADSNEWSWWKSFLAAMIILALAVGWYLAR